MARVIKAGCFAGCAPPRVIEAPPCVPEKHSDDPRDGDFNAEPDDHDPVELAKQEAANILAHAGKMLADTRNKVKDLEQTAQIAAAQTLAEARGEATRLTEAASADKRQADNLLQEAEERQTQAQRTLDEAKATADTLVAEAKASADKLVAEAKAEAATLLAEAKKESADLVEDAQHQSSVIREDARKQGHDEGNAAGRDEGARQVREEQKGIIADANAKAQKTMSDAQQAARWYVLASENKIAELVLQIADKVLPQHFIDAPTIILPLARQALQKVADQPTVRVSVAPGSYDLVLLARSELQQMLEGNGSLEILTDENLGPGDVVLDTPNGTVDATLSTQLDAIHAAVEKTLNKL